MNEHASYWDEHAASDPLWAVLSFPDKRGGRWNLREFMKTGEREIALLFHTFAELQLPVPHSRALDFGCGVGRLTQALARRQPHVLGVDISPVMIDLARRLNRYEHAAYMCSAETGLETLPGRSFGCIYSNIVLQHVPADLSVRYLRDFFRLLEPNGLMVFQLPSHRAPQGNAEIKPMPDGAYRATLELTMAAPITVAAGSEFNVAFTVRNISDHTWSQPEYGPLAVGNHWLDARGELMLTQDDGRSPLLQVVPPGLEWPVLLTIHAPGDAGRYVCEIDLVHEGVSWWADKGSTSIQFAIDVVDADRASTIPRAAMMTEFPVPDYPEDVLPPAQGSLPPSPGNFPMHGVPREDVLSLIREHGARLAYLEEDRRAGPEWVSYRYFVAGRDR